MCIAVDDFVLVEASELDIFSRSSLFDLGRTIAANVNQSLVQTPGASYLLSSCNRLKRSVFGPRSRLRCGLAFEDNRSSVAYAYWSPFL